MPSLQRIIISFLLLLLTSCAPAVAPTPTLAPASPDQLPDSEQPSPAPLAEAARVNGEIIYLSTFERHLALYRDAQKETGTLLASEDVEQIVLDDLIARLLLAQGARAAGFSITESLVDDRLTALIEQAGGQSTFDQWLTDNRYTAETFREDLIIEIEAGWMRTQITDSVPRSAEHVLARQILLSDLFSAERLLAQLDSGTPFETVVINNDPQRLGNLGWFPRGFLFQPEVEDAAFALQPGEYSGVVETDLGFHLIEVLDRDPDRELTPLARLQLQMDALEDWIGQQRQQSEIDVFLP